MGPKRIPTSERPILSTWLAIGLLPGLLVLPFCGEDKPPTGPPTDADGKPLRVTNNPARNIHTAAKPGKWESVRFDHTPIIEYKASKREISVELPMTGKPSHYAEFILLADGRLKELEKVTFKPGQSKYRAKFLIPKKIQKEVWVIFKCNLHDMWGKKIKLDE